MQVWKDLGNQTGQAVSLHIQANAHIMAGREMDALQAAEEAGGIFKDVDDAAGEAGAKLLAAGVHLAAGDVGEAKAAGKEAEKMYKALNDGPGEDSAADFVDSLKKYESGD